MKLANIKKTLYGVYKKKYPSNLILNEAVNFEKGTIFIAIPKTGTTTVRSQMQQKGFPLIPNSHLDIVQIRDTLYTFFLIQSLGKNTHFPSKGTRVDADVHKQADEAFQTFFKFAAVRNPWARAVSLYSRREGITTKERISFNEFCKKINYASDTCIHPTIHRNQLDWLCDETKQNVMDYVYKLENFDQAIKEIAELTNGKIQLRNNVVNQNPASHAHSYRELYTEETRKIIAKKFEKDIDYFKYVF